VRDVAAELFRAHDDARLILQPTGGGDLTFATIVKRKNKIAELHAELVDKARADLGLAVSDRASPGPRSWGVL